MDETSQLAEQMPPTIGRYKVVERVGEGAMGVVYEAFDPLIKRTLAIKTIRLDIPRQSPQYRTFIDRFYHEARISGTLSHPNIVTLFDIGDESGLPFLAMEFVKGETVGALIDKGHRFKPEKVISLVSQIASALDYAHSKGIIHRDIKPSNLILYEDDKVKVTDFGIAKLIDAEMTQSGTLLGTPSYMSPEQAMGEKLDGRSDIFSLGVCAFEMLSGEQPFPGNNVTSILYKLVHVDPIEPANLEMNGLVPQKWHEVFGKVLAKKPDERYQTAAEFVHDLEYCLGSWFGSLEDTLITGGGDSTVTLPRMAAPLVPAPRAEEPTAPMSIPDLVAPPVRVAGATTTRHPAAEDPSTIVMKAPAGTGDSSTIVLKAPPPRGGPDAADPATVVMKATPPPPPRAPEEPTVIVGADEAVPAPAPRPSAAPEATTVKVPPPPPLRPVLSPRGLLAGVAGLFLLAAVALGLVFMRRSAPADAPVAVATPAPPVAAPPTTEPPIALNGSIRVETEPAGAAVTVNGETHGAAPLDLAEVPLGTYEVKVQLKGFEPMTQTVTLTEDASRGEIKVALVRAAAPTTGVADILSTPFGATVTVDGAKVGMTPVTGVRLKPGTRQVEVAREGYEAWAGTLLVQAGQRSRIDAALRALPRSPPPPPVDVVDTSRIYANTPAEVDTTARKTAGTSVSYPEGAPRLRSGDSISVSVAFVVTESGDVTDARVVESGGRILDEAVVGAVRGWKYAPAVKKGTKVKVQVTFKQTFRAG